MTTTDVQKTQTQPQADHPFSLQFEKYLVDLITKVVAKSLEKLDDRVCEMVTAQFDCELEEIDISDDIVNGTEDALCNLDLSDYIDVSDLAQKVHEEFGQEIASDAADELARRLQKASTV